MRPAALVFGWKQSATEMEPTGSVPIARPEEQKLLQDPNIEHDV